MLDFQKFEIFKGRSDVKSPCTSSCQISSKSVKRLQRYGDLTVFKMAAVRHLGFVIFEFFLTAGAVKKPILHQHTKFRKDRSNRCGDIAVFVIFKMVAAAILNFQKIQNFDGRSAVGGQCASSCQILSKSVKRLQRYGDLTVFKMAAVRHLGFVKFEFFNSQSG